MAAPLTRRPTLRVLGQLIDYFPQKTPVKAIGLNRCIRGDYFSTKSPKPKKGYGLFATVGGAAVLIGAGAGLASYYTSNNTASSPKQGVVTDSLGFEDKERPDFKPSREVRVETDNSGLKLTLFQYQTCPFCCKVRAVLDYHGFSYDVIEVNSITKKQMKWSSYPKVPLLVAEIPGTGKEVILRDSSVIISALESYLSDRSTNLEKYLSFYPCYTEVISGKKRYDFPNKYFIMYQETADIGTTPKERSEERKWRRWADDHLVHMLSPNAYRTPSEALQAFNYFSHVGEWEKNFTFFERLLVIYAGATVMYVLGKVLKSRYNLKDDVRESLYEACNEWMKRVKQGKQPFHGGAQPNLADLAVYGVMNSIEGCSAFDDALQKTNIGPWYNRTKLAIQQHQGSNPLHAKTTPSDVKKQPSKK